MKKSRAISRRQAIKTGAAVAAAVSILPRHVLGGPGQTAPNEKLNIAIRTDERLLWDGPNLRFTNSAGANELINPPCRPGWEIA